MKGRCEKEFRSPRFGDTPNQSPLKAGLQPLDANQSMCVLQRKTQGFTFQAPHAGWVLTLPSVLWLPLEGQARGLEPG